MRPLIFPCRLSHPFSPSKRSLRLGALLCWLTALLFAAPLHSQPSDPIGAACVIRVGEQVLLVQDRLSRRFSLSGGYIDGDEKPEQAALRELWEETGLHGRIIAPLTDYGEQRGRARFFACQSLEPIRWQLSSRGVEMLQAPNLGSEIMSVRLVDPRHPEVPLRFAKQLQDLHLAELLHSLPESPNLAVPNFWAHASAWQVKELHWSHAWQQATAALAPLWALTNLLGEGGSYLLLLPLLLPWLGWRASSRILAALAVVNLLIQLAKLGLALPRPLHFDPELALRSASGFGMPSGHTALAMLCWGLLLPLWLPKRPWCVWLGALLLSLLTGGARVYYGVHFVSDVAGGLLLGSLLLALWPQPDSQGAQWLVKAPIWWGLALLNGIGALWLFDPSLLFGGAVAGGIAWGLRNAIAREPVAPPARLSAMACSLAGSLLVMGLLATLPQLLQDSKTLLVSQALLYFALGWWLTHGCWLAIARLDKPQKIPACKNKEAALS